MDESWLHLFCRVHFFCSASREGRGVPGAFDELLVRLQALMDMFYQDEGSGVSAANESHIVAGGAPRNSLTYEEVVRELMASERQYLRELHMIIKVFR